MAVYARHLTILTGDDSSHCAAGNAGDQTPGGLPDRAGGGGAAHQFYSGPATTSTIG